MCCPSKSLVPEKNIHIHFLTVRFVFSFHINQLYNRSILFTLVSKFLTFIISTVIHCPDCMDLCDSSSVHSVHCPPGLPHWQRYMFTSSLMFLRQDYTNDQWKWSGQYIQPGSYPFLRRKSPAHCQTIGGLVLLHPLPAPSRQGESGEQKLS